MGLSTTLLVATFGTLLAAFPGAIPATWNFAIIDQILHWLPAPNNSGLVAYVEIDDASLGAIGRWPWPRKRTAELINKIHDAGAKSVVVDLFFPEAENPASDQELAASLQRANAWIGYQFRFTEPNGKPCATNSIPVVMRRSGMAQNPDLFEAAPAGW
ncbi:MAG: CHASE2 domain-containing protein [Acidobacteria bacterium]|nr:CHASE2 domain-containing protein [Acidobacteriota bacterium]